jgi:hypothetical protein
MSVPEAQQQVVDQPPQPVVEQISADVVEYKESIVENTTLPRRTSNELLTEANINNLASPPVSTAVNASPIVPVNDTGTPNSNTLNRLTTQGSSDKLDR